MLLLRSHLLIILMLVKSNIHTPSDFSIGINLLTRVMQVLCRLRSSNDWTRVRDTSHSLTLGYGRLLSSMR